MKQISIKVATFVLFFCSITSCEKSTPGGSGCKWAAMPSSLFFKIKINGQVQPDSFLQNVKISYLKDGTKSYLNDLTLAIDYYANKGILATRMIGIVSADMNIKNFTIEYPNNLSNDLFNVDYLPSTPSSNCVYVLNKVSFNNVDASIDNSFMYQPVYTLNKP